MPLVQLRSIILALSVAAPLAGCVEPTKCGPETRKEFEVVGDEVRGIAKYVSAEKVESNLVDDWGGLEGVGAYPLDPDHRPGALVMRWAGEANWEYAVSLFGAVASGPLSANAAVACGCPGVLDLTSENTWRCFKNGTWGPARCLPLRGTVTVRSYVTYCDRLVADGKELCAENLDLDVKGDGSADGDAFTADFTLRRYERFVDVPLACE